MAILGAHMSTSGGFYRAIERAEEETCDCVQVFLFPPRQWPVKPPGLPKTGTPPPRSPFPKTIPADQAEQFRTTLAESPVSHPIAHASYLINLASSDPDLWKRSVNALIAELRRAEQLGIPYVVLHPGSHMGAGEEVGIRKVCRALNEIHRRTSALSSQCLLETTAGQGTCLGWRFEHLAAMVDGIREPDRVGICFDTCHVFAAGYAMGNPDEYRATMRTFNKLIGVGKIRAFHLNDSKRELGSRVDRHDHIGGGEMGLEPFRLLLNDRRFRSVPMYLETPKGEVKMGSCDKVNLCTLRSLSYS